MKIVVYEDHWSDVRRRYKPFIGGHDFEIYVHLNTDERFNRALEYLTENGFPSEIIHFGIPQETPEADLYFCDGLNGYALKVLPKLPKDKSFLLSGDDCLVARVRAEDFGIVDSQEKLDSLINLTNQKASIGT